MEIFLISSATAGVAWVDAETMGVALEMALIVSSTASNSVSLS